MMGLMYHGQIMLALVLSVEQNDHKRTKKQEMTMHFLFREYCGIVSDSRKSYHPGDGFKSRSRPKRKKEYVPVDRVEQFLAQESESGFLAAEFEKREQVARKTITDTTSVPLHFQHFSQ